MRYSFIALVLFLSACAHDNYSVIPDTGASKENMASDLSSCKKEAIDAYYSQKDMASYREGLVASGLVGGAIGGAAFGAATFQDDGSMKTSDLDLYIEKCMARKGYSGTST